MILRNTRPNKPPAKPSRLPDGRSTLDPDPLEQARSSSKGKNPRERSSDESNEEPCAAPPLKKRAINRRLPPTAIPSPVSQRAPSRRSTRNVARSAKKEVSEPVDPDPDIIIIDDDGYPYAAYDDAPHLHPPPRRYKQSKATQPSASWEKIKGCSIKPCWTLTQQRRCRILQMDEAVEEIGWKKLRKWMQAVRCGLCGETQVLRDLTKGCFNLEHWWRHLRVRHGIRREDEIDDKGEEKYKTLPIKDHVCVGACSTCGEGGAVVSNPHNHSARFPRKTAIEQSDFSSLSSGDTAFIPPPESIPETILTSTPHIERQSPGHPPRAGPSNINNPPPHSALYTSANSRPEYRYESVVTLTTFPTSSCRDLPGPLIPESWAPYTDPSGARNRPEAAGDAPLFIHRQSPATTVASPTTKTSTTPAAHTRPTFPSRPTSTVTCSSIPSAMVPSASHPLFTSTESTSSVRVLQSRSTPAIAAAVAAAPNLSDYRWPPANNVPVGAPSPQHMTVASWEEADAEDEGEEPSTLDRLRDIRTEDASETEDGGEDHITRNEMEASACLLHHFFVSAWEHHEMASAHGIIPRPTGETVGATASERSLYPGWAFIKQEESEPEPESDEDEDMIDQLLGDN